MKIFIGADHRGFKLKQVIAAALRQQGHEIIDAGTYVEGVDCDYPNIAREVAVHVVKNPGSRGILLCMTGIGHSIAANKVPGAYAALVYNREAAQYACQHNNSNILVLGAKFMDEAEIEDIARLWLSAKFEGGRHQRRFDQIQAMEKEFFK